MKSMKQYLKNLALNMVTFLELISKKFITFHTRPQNVSKVLMDINPQINLEKHAIVVQGPIIENNNFTLETIRLYKKIFKKAKIIVSTWKDTSISFIEKFKKEDVYLLLNEKPQIAGQQNINYQIISSRNGIQKAKELNCDYVLKTRTDQRIYNPSTLEFMCNIINFFSIKQSCNQKKRIVGVSLNTFKYRLYGLSDMTLFGTLEDMELYWNAELDEREKGINEPFNYLKLSLCEVYLTTKFLKTIGREVLWTLKNSYQAFVDHFCIVDEKSIDLYWYKYARIKEYRYKNYKFNPEKEELTFADWFSLYTNLEKVTIPTGYDII